ncbi:hypothetical protein GH714_041446 [Hevea brasiliensis]|uniref:Uncharacterized protein n=1 Tax=Hevea brasiliensis TaxID=3981 RepID=A0A6A6MVD2_HEVBR|nr:hypothetical protein GH714_041446 [Hevea brasiliensis]
MIQPQTLTSFEFVAGVWMGLAPLKVEVFSWLTLLGRVSTRDLLLNRVWLLQMVKFELVYTERFKAITFPLGRLGIRLFTKGDQASIVGGAIEFVKELEHLLHSLEAQKVQLLHGLKGPSEDTSISTGTSKSQFPPPFAQFFVYPQYTCSQMPNKYTSKAKASIADIEVTLIETHANLRILSRKRPRQLFKFVTGFQTLYLTILHINVTTMDPLVLYSISAKLEEECQLTSVDDIAGAVHHMLRKIEEETTLF